MLNKIKPLDDVAVFDGHAVATDLTMFLLFPLEASEGLHRREDLFLGAYVKPRPLDDFPEVPEVEALETAPLPEDLRWVLQAASKEEFRPHLSAVEIGPMMTATDGHRLHQVPGTTLEEPLLVPREAAVLIEKLTRGKDVLLTRGRAWHCAQWDECLLIFKGSEGRFPPWEKVIPCSFKGSIELERAPDLRAAAKASRAYKKKRDMGGDTYPAVRLEAQDGQLSGTVAWPEGSLDVAPVPCDGDDFQIAVDPSYLQDALRWEKGPFTLSFNGPRDGLQVTTSSGRLAIVMPVRP